MIFDRPSLANKPQQRLRAGGQGCDESVGTVKRFAVTPAGAIQLDDQIRACARLADGVMGIACYELHRNR
jgi:hypothetical protein